MDPVERERQLEIEAQLACAQPWARRFWEDGHGRKIWDFAAFLHPDLEDVDDWRREDPSARRDGALWWARDAVGLGGVLGEKWRIRLLDWPGDGEEEEGGEDESEGDEDGESVGNDEEDGASNGRKHDHSTKEEVLKENDEAFHAELAMLREHFHGLRALPKGLPKGILRNTFLLFTRPCLEAVLAGYVDNMWLCAVDPDYDEEASASGPSARCSEEDTAPKYRGFLRVRLQQPVNNFFEVRKFQEDECPLQRLWEVAERSRGNTFVSLREEEMGLWTPSRDVASVLGAPRTEKVVTST